MNLYSLRGILLGYITIFQYNHYVGDCVHQPFRFSSFHLGFLCSYWICLASFIYALAENRFHWDAPVDKSKGWNQKVQGPEYRVDDLKHPNQEVKSSIVFLTVWGHLLSCRRQTLFVSYLLLFFNGLKKSSKCLNWFI